MRHGMTIAAAALVLALTADAALAQRGGPPQGRGPGGGAGMAGRGMTAAEHGNIQALLQMHESIKRRVEEVPGGVKTTNTATDPRLVPVLRVHVRQMAGRLENRQPVRIWDPVFREIFANAGAISLTFRDIEGGIEVLETSDDPNVTRAIRAHARKVDSFVARGHEAAMPPWAGGRGRGPGGPHSQGRPH